MKIYMVSLFHRATINNTHTFRISKQTISSQWNDAATLHVIFWFMHKSHQIWSIVKNVFLFISHYAFSMFYIATIFHSTCLLFSRHINATTKANYRSMWKPLFARFKICQWQNMTNLTKKNQTICTLVLTAGCNVLYSEEAISALNATEL